jgi:hypothetical protein
MEGCRSDAARRRSLAPLAIGDGRVRSADSAAIETSHGDVRGRERGGILVGSLLAELDPGRLRQGALPSFFFEP